MRRRQHRWARCIRSSEPAPWTTSHHWELFCSLIRHLGSRAKWWESTEGCQRSAETFCRSNANSIGPALDLTQSQTLVPLLGTNLTCLGRSQKDQWLVNFCEFFCLVRQDPVIEKAKKPLLCIIFTYHADELFPLAIASWICQDLKSVETHR